jgi:multimeric flavodoxin WrbA
MAIKVLILDGSTASDSTGKRVLAALKNELQSVDREVEHLVLRDKKIGNCVGDFYCWIRTPGLCMVNDDSRAVAQAVIGCDVLIFLTPIMYGGYSSTLKRAVDRLTQNNLPFFEENGGEIHHQPRYQRNPKLLAIGWLDAAEENEEAIFQALVQRNAHNMHFPNAMSAILYTEQTYEEITSAVRDWVNDTQNGKSSPAGGLPRFRTSPLSKNPIRNAILLVGSPRGKRSTSQALGGYLFEQLSAHNLQISTACLYPALNSSEGLQSLLEAVDTHDLILLAAPLYIDSLPGPVMQAMEMIAHHCVDKTGQHVFSAMINCGFPEAKQCELALTICAAFARQAGFAWAGGVALGGGAGVVNGTPLADLGWRAKSIRKALELTACSLAAGQPIPEEAIRLMGKTRIPKWLLFLASDFGWKQRSREFGAEKLLRRQPYWMD